MPARKHIDRAKIIQVAVTLADIHGWEAVTLASVAEQLDIRIPSLYNHIAGLPGLRRELTLWGLRELADQLRRAAVGRAQDEAIFCLADAYRAFTHKHPGIYAATLRAAPPDDPDWIAAAQDILDIVLAVLRPYDFDAEGMLHAVRGLRSVLHGFVALETSGGFGLPLDRDESFRRLLQTFIQGLRTATN